MPSSAKRLLGSSTTSSHGGMATTAFQRFAADVGKQLGSGLRAEENLTEVFDIVSGRNSKMYLLFEYFPKIR